jgi:iron complex outermembrane receptor protein
MVIRVAAAALSLGVCRFAFAQSAPTSSAAGQEIVELPKFVITETRTNPYQSAQALSTSRIAVGIQDIPQTVSVVTSDFIQDTQGNRMLDVAKYVTPIVESSLPYSGDRYHIRGFQVSAEFVDGCLVSGLDGYNMTQNTFNIERIEVIKGPNAILVPGGSPGGVMNPITKEPLFNNQGSATVELARYWGSNVNFDINRVLSRNVAARIVFGLYDGDGYSKNEFKSGYEFAPSLKWKISDTTELVVKADIIQNRTSYFSGLPLDPTVGSNDFARIVPGLARDWSFGNKSDTTHREAERVYAELRTVFGEHVTSRLFVMGDHIKRLDYGQMSASGIQRPDATSLGGTSGLGGSRNPTTGLWVPGVNYTVASDGTITATNLNLPDPSQYLYVRAFGRNNLDYTEAHLKNDYAIQWNTDWFKSATISGISANFSKVIFISNPSASRPSVPASQLDAITYPPFVYGPPTTAAGNWKIGKQADLQLFVYEQLKLFKDRVIFAGGVSRWFGYLDRVDTRGIPPVATLNGQAAPSLDNSVNDTSLGIVVKPIQEISLFAGVNRTGGGLPGSLSAGNTAPPFLVAVGTQKEFGVKTAFFDGRLTAAWSHFDISQTNYPVPNSNFYIDNTQPPTLYLDLTSKGWEFETSYAVNKNLTIMGNYSKYQMRQPLGVKYRGVPDENGAMYVDYKFTDGALKGFGCSLGVDYKGDFAGDQVAPGYTDPTHGRFVPNQPSFLVAGRTLFNVGLSYAQDNWKVRVNIDNATDKEYILASGSRTALIVGVPRAWKVSFTYKF